MKIRRALAFFIDWFFCAFLGLVGGFLVFYKISTRVSDVKGIFFQSPEGMEAFIQNMDVKEMLLILVLYLSPFALFVLRDALLGGRSLGKRLLRLYVVDNGAGAAYHTPNIFQLIFRNVFFFIYPIDALVVLFTDRSLGDMITNTRIVKP
jgi:uncharacterized RDD family membrane protein YckC